MSLREKFTKAFAVPALIASTSFAGAAYAGGEGWDNRHFDRHDHRDYRVDRRPDPRFDRRFDRERRVYVAPRPQPRYDWEYGYYPVPPAPVYVQPAPRVYVQPVVPVAPGGICIQTRDRHFSFSGCF